MMGKFKQKNGSKSKWDYSKYLPFLYTSFNVSEQCCDIMKKAPVHRYQSQTGKVGITAQMACESRMRLQKWLQNGCNAFDNKYPVSNPMSFWTEQDVLKYIYTNKLPIASVYGDVIIKHEDDIGDIPQIHFEDCENLENSVFETTGSQRTGCIFCGFGCHLEKGETRFQRLKRTHPKQYNFCMNGGEYDENGIWKPNKDGLGMAHVFDEINKIYGDDFIRYK